MKVAAIIPARYGSSRLAGKPLLRAGGKVLVQHVWEGIRASTEVDDLVVATDDERILEAVEGFGGRAVMTRGDHPSGTDRVHEAASGIRPPPDIVLNIQGDEPGAGPAHVSLLVRLLREDGGAAMSTLAYPAGPEARGDPGRVKVVLGKGGRALYFSRAPIPFDREGGGGEVLVHAGLYGYRREVLERFVSLPPSPLERRERLEQLRALEAGLRIVVGRIEAPLFSVDTPEDFEVFSARQGS